MTPVRLRPLAASLACGLALSLGLAACGDDATAGPPATVDGVDITPQELADELAAFSSNQAFVDALEAAGQSGQIFAEEADGATTSEGDGEGDDGSDDASPDGELEFAPSFVRTVLGNQIVYRLLFAAAEERGVVIDDDCRAEAEANTVAGFAGLSPSDGGQSVFDAFPESYRTAAVERQALLQALGNDLVDQPCTGGDTDAAVEAYFAENEDTFADYACVSHILVATEEEAQAVEDRLAAGEAFEDLATELSTDTGSAANGGSLGCASTSGYTANFADAALAQEVGEVGPPVETEFGFHVIRVDRRPVELDDVRTEVEGALDTERANLFQTFILDALAAAEVTVDARYGTWNAEQAQIDEPVPAGTPGAGVTDTTVASGG